MPDFIYQHQAHGSVAATLLATNGDWGSLRSFIGYDGNSYVTRNTNQRDNKGQLIYKPFVTNAPAALRFQDWREIDRAVIRVAKPRLQIIADLRASGLEVSLQNGMGTTVFSYEDESDTSRADISMDGIRRTQGDRPVYQIKNLPIPIIHKDFSYSVRQILASRNGGSPLDMTGPEQAASRCAEEAEMFALGLLDPFQFGGGTAYGILNFPSRMTKDLTTPGSGGWTPNTTVQEVLAMRQQSMNAFHYGDWMLYNSPNWDEYLDEDYSSAKGDNTLRMRLKNIKGIKDVKTVDYLQFVTNNPFTLLLVQQTGNVIREVIAMDFTTLQWNSPDGLEMNFKVMGSMTPQLRTDQNGRTGIVHGSADSD